MTNEATLLSKTNDTSSSRALTPTAHEATVQYEHTLVATRRGPVVVTLAE